MYPLKHQYWPIEVSTAKISWYNLLFFLGMFWRSTGTGLKASTVYFPNTAGISAILTSLAGTQVMSSRVRPIIRCCTYLEENTTTYRKPMTITSQFGLWLQGSNANLYCKDSQVKSLVVVSGVVFSLGTNEDDTLPYRPVWPIYTVLASAPV